MTDQTAHEDRVESYLQRIARGSDFPAISAHIRAVMAILDNEDASLQQLANIILKDHSLTVKVLRTANSTYYNRYGVRILSVTQAIMMLGIRSVRHLASSLIVLEHYQKNFPGLKELMVLSILTAAHAQETAAYAGYGRPEEAYLLGMFHNLGEMFIACYCPEDYTAILARMKETRKTADEACLAVLNFSFKDLAEAVARSWGIADLGGPSESHFHSQITSIISFSHELTTAVYRQDEGKQESVSKVLQRYGNTLGLSAENLHEILESGISETQEVFSNLRVSISDLMIRKQTEVVLESLLGTKPLDIEEQPVPTESPQSEESRGRFLQEVEAAIDRSTHPDLNQTLLLIIEAMYRSGPFDHAIFCIVNSDRTAVSGRFGLGDRLEHIFKCVGFPLTLSPKRSPIGYALLRKNDLFLSAKADLTLDENECMSRLGVQMVGVLPIVIEEKLIGALYMDRTSSPTLPDERTMSFLMKLRVLAVTAIASSRTKKKPATPALTPSFTPERKYAIVLRALGGESLNSLSKEIEVPASEIEAWQSSFLSSALAGLKQPPRE
jgi:HD-like signal output (HDOD) protein